MHRVALDDPRMAVKPRAFVPPALHRRGVNADGEVVGLVVIGIGRQVDIGRGIARPVAIDQRAIEPDRGEGGHAVQLQFDMFAVVGPREQKRVAIPGDAALAITLIDISILIERLGTGEIVRQGDVGPCAVIIIHRGRAERIARLGRVICLVMRHQRRHGDIAFVEAPALVERPDLPRRGARRCGSGSAGEDSS